MYKTSGVAIAATIMLAACSAPSPEVEMANPASDYCVKLGGKLTIENSANGQIGICELPDGTRIEEWELYRRDHAQVGS